VSNPKVKAFPRPGTEYGTIGGSFPSPDLRRAKVDRTRVVSQVNANSEKNATAIEILKSQWTRADPPYMRLSNMAGDLSKGSSWFRSLDLEDNLVGSYKDKSWMEDSTLTCERKAREML
jgi:hypothetical protein